MENILVISCIFGKNFKFIHPSPDNKNSYFFTNNPKLESEIIKKGWNYVYINKILSDNIILSSLQSKYIKFLQFINDFPEFKNRMIIYVDHKECINYLSLNQIKQLINENIDKSLIIRQTPYNKTNIYQEINEAKLQKRYAQNMNLTIKFVELLESSNKINTNVVICNTGLLIYINLQYIFPLLNNVYNMCLKHQQPECQIYWSIFSQFYKNKIKEINYNTIKYLKRTNPIR